MPYACFYTRVGFSRTETRSQDGGPIIKMKRFKSKFVTRESLVVQIGQGNKGTKESHFQNFWKNNMGFPSSVTSSAPPRWKIIEATYPCST